MTFSLYKIKKDKRQMWLDWCKEVMDAHYDEACFSLTEEDLIRERCFIFGDDNDGYVVYVHEPLPGKKRNLLILIAS